MDTLTPSTLLERRLIYLTGKGGVGKSTVAAALGLLAARRGLRTIIVEVSARGDVPRLFGRRSRRGDEHMLAPRLHAIAIEPDRAMEEYLREQLPGRMVADLLGSSRTFAYLAAATPGLRELLTIGKIWELAQPQRRTVEAQAYDLVIVDAPATGHGLALLGAPRTFTQAAAHGPIARHGAAIQATLLDQSFTAVVGIATPREAAVSELIALREALESRLEIAIAAVIVNALRPARFDGADRSALEGALEGAPDSPSSLAPDARAAVALALTELSSVAGERAQLLRLREWSTAPLLELARARGEELGAEDLDLLAEQLGGFL